MRPDTRSKTYRAEAHRRHRATERMLRHLRRGCAAADIYQPGAVLWAELTYANPDCVVVQPVVLLSKPDSDGQALALRLTHQSRTGLLAIDWQTANLRRRSFAHPFPIRIDVAAIAGVIGRIDVATIPGVATSTRADRGVQAAGRKSAVVVAI
jgi:hypothetical protein